MSNGKTFDRKTYGGCKISHEGLKKSGSNKPKNNNRVIK